MLELPISPILNISGSNKLLKCIICYNKVTLTCICSKVQLVD